MLEIETTVGGHECIASLISYTPGDPGRTWGRPEDCYPEEGPEIDFEILDMDGKPARHLDALLTDAELDRITAELLEAIEREERKCI